MLTSCNNISILEIDGVLENESFPKRSKEQLIVSEHPCIRAPLLDCFSLFSEPPSGAGNRLSIIFWISGQAFEMQMDPTFTVSKWQSQKELWL